MVDDVAIKNKRLGRNRRHKYLTDEKKHVEYGMFDASGVSRRGWTTDAGVAQLVEQLTCNQQVVRSNRIAGSR